MRFTLVDTEWSYVLPTDKLESCVGGQEPAVWQFHLHSNKKEKAGCCHGSKIMFEALGCHGSKRKKFEAMFFHDLKFEAMGFHDLKEISWKLGVAMAQVRFPPAATYSVT